MSDRAIESRDPTVVAAIVLAAGESRRMGTPKALLRLGNSPFIETIFARLREAGMGEVVVVLGARAGEVAAAARLPGAAVVVNRDFERGQLSSLQCGLRAVSEAAGAALVTLVDHPLVAASTYAGMRTAWEADPGKILVAAHDGRRGHPVIFPRAVFGELMEAPAGEGARAVVRRDPARVRSIGFDDPGVTADIDDPADYERFVRGGGRS
ncbi:MAG: nucleotidyltransferase family protein [bacterium]|nr:nucleotidyltransferase family protein [bacterium]